MDTHDKLAGDLNRIYVHLQLLDLLGFVKSKEFDLFCEEQGLEKFRDTIFTSLYQRYFSPKSVIYLLTTSGKFRIDFSDFPEALVKPFLKDFLVEIYSKKNELFIEIVVSFLTYYSLYNRDFRDGKPTPIDDNIMRKIALDLVDLRDGDDEVRMFFKFAGYDIDALLSFLDPESTEIQDDRILEANNRKVFIVHGQDEKIKSEVEEFLISIDLDPIILHKQADLGKTIIEKVEYYSDVGFAVIVLTNDDFGGVLPSGQATTYDLLLFNCLINPKLLEDISEKEREILKSQFIKWIEKIASLLKPRARQNVIFEFGYFIAKLGRGRVAALCESDIERPSDINGLLYTPLDQKGEWKKKLAKEIDASGIKIDEKYLT